MAEQTILDIFLEHVHARGSETGALVKRESKYEPVTWAQMWADATAIAKGLIASGIELNDHVNIVAHTRLEWVTIDLGVLAAGAVTVPVYPSSLADECQYITSHAEVRLVFAENAEQVAKYRAKRSELPKVMRVVQIDGETTGDDDWVVSYADFLKAGESITDEQVDERRAGLTPESILTIIYTSGTTGRPKGVVLTHANMAYEAEAVRAIDLVRQDDVQLYFLPLAHVFAKVLEIGWFASGHVMAFAEDLTTIKDNLGETRPTLMCGVPRIFEKFYAAVVDKATAEEGLKKKLFLAALDLSQKNGELEERGEALGIRDSIKFAVLQQLVFSKIGEALMTTMGGRMRVMLSGGAPLSKKINWFFRDAGITIVEGYGMTETSAGTAINLPHSNQIGSVGPALPGTQLKIAPDGEVLIKGPGVMREYWRNPEATAETIVDGWLHSGDIGELDPRTKALRITDRKKDLIVTAGGKNVAPQKIENLIKTHKMISQVVVHGDRRKFLTALVTLDEPMLMAWAKTQGVSGSYAQVCKDPKVRAEIERIVEDANGELASFETVKKFEILDADFSVETGELTPKLSVKRKVVNSRFGPIFDAFYTESF